MVSPPFPALMRVWLGRSFWSISRYPTPGMPSVKLSPRKRISVGNHLSKTIDTSFLKVCYVPIVDSFQKIRSRLSTGTSVFLLFKGVASFCDVLSNNTCMKG